MKNKVQRKLDQSCFLTALCVLCEMGTSFILLCQPIQYNHLCFVSIYLSVLHMSIALLQTKSTKIQLKPAVCKNNRAITVEMNLFCFVLLNTCLATQKVNQSLKILLECMFVRVCVCRKRVAGMESPLTTASGWIFIAFLMEARHSFCIAA